MSQYIGLEPCENDLVRITINGHIIGSLLTREKAGIIVRWLENTPICHVSKLNTEWQLWCKYCRENILEGNSEN